MPSLSLPIRLPGRGQPCSYRAADPMMRESGPDGSRRWRKPPGITGCPTIRRSQAPETLNLLGRSAVNFLHPVADRQVSRSGCPRWPIAEWQVSGELPRGAAMSEGYGPASGLFLTHRAGSFLLWFSGADRRAANPHHRGVIDSTSFGRDLRRPISLGAAAPPQHRRISVNWSG